jgi:hypothetical protein
MSDIHDVSRVVNFVLQEVAGSIPTATGIVENENINVMKYLH